jgi:Acetoacetate decarboxylase (ADC)
MMYAMDRSELGQISKRELEAKFPGAEMLFAMYRTDPAVVAKILPKPLEPFAEPLAFVFVARYPETNFGSVYNEGALILLATYKGEIGGYCLSMPVTEDMAMIGGREVHGFPKKIAEEISLEREGDRVSGRVVRRGTEILRITCELKERGQLSDMSKYMSGTAESVVKDLKGKECLKMVSFLFKHFPASNMMLFDYIPRLVRQVSLFRPREDLMMGEGEVVVTSSPRDPLGEVPVRGVEVVGYGTFDNDMLPGRVVARTWNIMKFLPHAFFSMDSFAVSPEPSGPPPTFGERMRRRRQMRKY